LRRQQDGILAQAQGESVQKLEPWSGADCAASALGRRPGGRHSRPERTNPAATVPEQGRSRQWRYIAPSPAFVLRCFRRLR
jgi:hypothetical protein